MKHFGEELKVVRESKNISLQDISKETRINIKFIEAIEAGDLSILPQTYIRAFIKSYAKHIGLDSEETIAKYEKYIGKKPTDSKTILGKEKTDDNLQILQSPKLDQSIKPDEPVLEKNEEPIAFSKTLEDSKNNVLENRQDTIEKSKTQKKSKVVDSAEYDSQKEHVKYVETPKVNYIVLFFVIAVAVIILFLVVLKVPFEETIEQVRVPIDNIVKETEQRYENKQDNIVTDSVPAITHIKSDSLVLGILTDTDVWVSIRMDQTGIDRGTVNANTIKYVTAKEKFTVTAARGKQIKLYLDDSLIGNLSQTDSVRSAIITLDGIVYLKPNIQTERPTPTKEDIELKPLEPVLP